MIFELSRRIWAKFKHLWFRLFCAPRMLACGKYSYVDASCRIDGAPFIRLGDETVVQARGWLYCGPVDGVPGYLTIGSRCVFGYNNHIAAVRNVVIEDDVLTANNVYISDNLHEYENVYVPIMQQPIRFKRSVRIGSGTWIGENVCVIGANVGRNCVIGANSVVTQDVPDYSVAIGVPAKVIKHFDHDAGKWVGKKG